MFSFLIASHLFKLIDSEDKIEHAINDLGNYNIIEHQSGQRIITFLSAFLNLKSGRKKELLKKIKIKIKKDRPYSPWLRYIIPNLTPIVPSITNLKKINSWSIKPLSFKKDMVLIPGTTHPQIEPFLISQTEVTNSQFLDFLRNTEDFIIENKTKMNAYGLYWTRKHKSNISNVETVNSYIEVINDYHLLLWVRNNSPIGKETHPVVYISWFAAAYYCNWLSLKRKLPMYYNFKTNTYNKLKAVVFQKNNAGYRLPTTIEWEVAAREGDFKIKHHGTNI